MPKQIKPGKGPTEEEIQTQLFQLAELHSGRFPLLRWLHAIPNGGYRKPGEAGRFKASGVKPGVPDIELPVALHGYNSLRIELKRGAAGKVSPAQQEWIDGLRNLGHCVQVCYSLDAAWAVLMWYLSYRQRGDTARCAVIDHCHRHTVSVGVIGTNFSVVVNQSSRREEYGGPQQWWFAAQHPREVNCFLDFCRLAQLLEY